MQINSRLDLKYRQLLSKAKNTSKLIFPSAASCHRTVQELGVNVTIVYFLRDCRPVVSGSCLLLGLFDFDSELHLCWGSFRQAEVGFRWNPCYHDGNKERQGNGHI